MNNPLTRFRILLGLQLGNAIGVWSQVVAGQWVLVEANASATLVAAVPALISVPFVFLSIPMGTFVARHSRESLMAAAMALAGSASIAAAVLDYLGLNHPAFTLVFVAIIGVGLLTVITSWQVLLPEILDREYVPKAIVLDSAAFNMARSLGPTLAGFGLALVGSSVVFLINGLLFWICAFSVLTIKFRWPHVNSRIQPIRNNIWSGVQYVRHSLWTRGLLFRLVIFGIPSASLWALLPLIVYENLAFTSVGMGVSVGMVGVGAVFGVGVVPILRSRLSVNAIAVAGTFLYSGILFVLALSRIPAVVFIALILVGLAWVGVQSTWMTLVNQVLPTWVRPQIVGIILFAFQGSQALGAFLWGTLSDILSLQNSVICAAVVMASGVLSYLKGSLTTPLIVEEKPQDSGEYDDFITVNSPLSVEFRYRLRTDQEEEFLGAMRDLRLSRLRLGARDWVLVRNPHDQTEYVESFRFRSGFELAAFGHERQTHLEMRLQHKVVGLSQEVDGPNVAIEVTVTKVR